MGRRPEAEFRATLQAANEARANDPDGLLRDLAVEEADPHAYRPPMLRGPGWPHEPTAETRKIVRALAAYGARRDDIAGYLHISKPTLLKHYGDELRRAKIEAVHNVARTLYQRAMAGEIGAAIFWLKTQGGWREAGPVFDEDAEDRLRASGGMDWTALLGDPTRDADEDEDDGDAPPAADAA